MRGGFKRLSYSSAECLCSSSVVFVTAEVSKATGTAAGQIEHPFTLNPDALHPTATRN